MTEYKPGTVAKATVRGEPNVLVTRYPRGWVLASDPDAFYNDNNQTQFVTDVRPLVVLDVSMNPVGWAHVVRDLRERGWDQLAREIEQQTRPTEPTGRGAIVEDEGVEWQSYLSRANGLVYWQRVTRTAGDDDFQRWPSSTSPYHSPTSSDQPQQLGEPR